MEEMNINRYAGDTYPSKAIIKIDGVAIDISDWDVVLKYKKPDGTVYRLKAIITDAKQGKVSIYPHAVIDDGETAMPEYNDYVSYEMVANGDEREVNQVWDEDEGGETYQYFIMRTKNYDDYVEEYTHISGKIVLLNRWGNN